MLNRPSINKAVIPAAGFGTRMLPATKAIPKEMLPVAGKPLIQYAVDEAFAAGIRTIVIVTRDRRSLIQEHFARDLALESFLADREISIGTLPCIGQSVDLQYVEQQQPLGLAHAISCAKSLIGEDAFVVLLPDVIMISEEPVIQQLIRAYNEQSGSIVAIRQVEAQDLKRHGIVRVDDRKIGHSGRRFAVTGLVEKPSVSEAPSRLGVFGRYLLEPDIWDAIACTKPDSRGEVQLTEALNLLCQTRSLSGLCFQGQDYDAGDRLGYLKANIELSLQDPLVRDNLAAHLSHITRLSR
jgi:UTP--glucose-1-phosphate uridylyltransferase